jgi:predicted DNA-binding protein (UPF0251 family)
VPGVRIETFMMSRRTKKIADAIVNGKAMKIEGGVVKKVCRRNML